MAERSWNELVSEGKQLLIDEEVAESSISWHWADLALEVEPMSERRGQSGGHARLQRWAEEIGWLETGRSFQTLLWYRDVASAWPPAKREKGATFSTHAELRSHPEREKVIRPGLSRLEARKLAGRKKTQRISGSDPAIEQVRVALSDPEVARTVMADPQVRHIVDEAAPTEERVERTQRALRDPAVARHVVQDTAARSSMARAAKEMEEESEQRQRERAPGLVGMSDFYQATGELSRARQALTKSLDAMRKVDLEGDQRESLKEDVGRVRLVLDWIDSYLESGDHSFDKALDALLREET